MARLLLILSADMFPTGKTLTSPLTTNSDRQLGVVAQEAVDSRLTQRRHTINEETV